MPASPTKEETMNPEIGRIIAIIARGVAWIIERIITPWEKK
jgi:hypothetical protein